MTEPVFVAEDQHLEEVLRAGRRRRARTALGAAGSALAVAAVVVLAPWQGAGGRESLSPADPPSPTPQVSRGPVAAATATTPAAPSGATVAPTGTPSPEKSAAAQPSASATAPSTSATGRPASSSQGSPITRGTARIAGTDLCQGDLDDSSNAADGWCVRYTGPTTARRGAPVTLSMELCRLGSFPAGTVTFESTRETLLSLPEPGWEAGEGGRYTSPGRTVTLPGTTCLTWASTWDTRDDDGFLVLPGDYAVQPWLEADLPLSTSYSVTLEVTD